MNTIQRQFQCEKSLGTDGIEWDYNGNISVALFYSMISDDSDGSVLVAALGGLHDPALYASELLHIEQVKPDGMCKCALRPNIALQQHATPTVRLACTVPSVMICRVTRVLFLIFSLFQISNWLLAA